MKVLVVGASGYLGGAAARALAGAGHEVTATARSDEARERLRSAGLSTVAGDAADPASLVTAARDADAVAVAMQLHAADAAAVETAALTALRDALAPAGKTLLYTSGVWYYGPTGARVADESTPANPPTALGARPGLERIVLDGAAAGLRAIVVRPGCVYGRAQGLPALFVASARERGAARTIGDGANRWSVVHVDDLGDFYVRALERAQPGDVFNATDDTAFEQRAIAAAASRAAGRDGRVEVWPVATAIAELGPWAVALAMDQRVTSARARSRLEWKPRAGSIVEDLERGSYASG